LIFRGVLKRWVNAENFAAQNGQYEVSKSMWRRRIGECPDESRNGCGTGYYGVPDWLSGSPNPRGWFVGCCSAATPPEKTDPSEDQ
jgi:hypothetical protein